MMKGFNIQQSQVLVEENMSNLTSASNEAASVSSVNINQSQPARRKRNFPGNPDPDAEVVALSPKSLMATNRFVCDTCGKGFQRDQNLQLHRRGHNLPWKLKQRNGKEVRKKVYVCPEANCVHHDPNRALGDLTGIKKHFSRKHGEKKWKCEKCSKRYAVQSDWKAHSKTCGTREYRCDCGTLFSRRDSFITHRAFCDALAEKSARGITGTLNLSTSQPSSQHLNLQLLHQSEFNPTRNLLFTPLKKEQCTFPSVAGAGNHMIFPIYPSILNQAIQENPTSTLPPYQYSCTNSSPHISATALLQKASQMGSRTSSSAKMLGGAHEAHVSAHGSDDMGQNLPSREGLFAGADGPGPYDDKAAETGLGPEISGPQSLLLLPQDMMMMTTSLSSSSATTGFEVPAFGYGFGEILKDENDNHNFHDTMSFSEVTTMSNRGNDGMATRDFLSLRPLPQKEIFMNIAGLGNCIGGSWPHGL